MEISTGNWIILVLILLAIGFLTYVFFFGQKLLQTKQKSDIDEEIIKKPKIKNTVKRNPEFDNELMDAVRNAKRSAKEQNELHKKQKVVEDDLLKKSELILSSEKREQNLEKKRLEEKRRKEDREKGRQLNEQRLKEKQEEERKLLEKDMKKEQAKLKREQYQKEREERELLRKQKQAEYMARKAQNEERKRQSEEHKRIYEENKKRQQEERERKRNLYKQRKENAGANQESIGENNTIQIDEPQDNIVDEPENNIVDEPENNIVDEPENNIVDEPENNIVDEPENNIVDEPENNIVDEPENNTIEEPVEEVIEDTLPIKRETITTAVREIKDDIEEETQDTYNKEEEYDKLTTDLLIGSIVPESVSISSSVKDVDISLLGSGKKEKDSLFKTKVMNTLDNFKKSQEKVGHVEINLDETPDEGLQFVDHPKEENDKTDSFPPSNVRESPKEIKFAGVVEREVENNIAEAVKTNTITDINKDESHESVDDKSNVTEETIIGTQTTNDVDNNKDNTVGITETTVKRSLFKETIFNSLDNHKDNVEKAEHDNINLNDNKTDSTQSVEDNKSNTKSDNSIDKSTTDDITTKSETRQSQTEMSSTSVFSTTRLSESTSYSSSISSSTYKFGSTSMSSPVRSGSNIQIRSSSLEGGENISVSVKDYTHIHIFNTANHNTEWPGIELEKSTNSGYLKGFLKDCKSASVVLYNKDTNQKSDDFEITEPGDYFVVYGKLKKVSL